MKKNQIAIPAKESNLKSINLSDFAKELSAKEFKERGIKESLYKYPSEWKKDKINSDEGKKWRNNKRNRIKSLCNNILFYAKGDNIPALQKEIASFESFYKEYYLKNDFSPASISNSKDEGKEKDIALMMKIIIKCKG